MENSGVRRSTSRQIPKTEIPYQSWLRDIRNGRGVLSRLCWGMLGSGESSFILPESPRSIGEERKAVPFMEDIYLLAKVFSLSPGRMKYTTGHRSLLWAVRFPPFEGLLYLFI